MKLGGRNQIQWETNDIMKPRKHTPIVSFWQVGSTYRTSDESHVPQLQCVKRLPNIELQTTEIFSSIFPE